MPCTEGGAPVTIDRLFGFVKLGITQSAISAVPLASTRFSHGMWPCGDGLGEVVGLAAVDADDDGRAARAACSCGVDGEHRSPSSRFGRGRAAARVPAAGGS